MSTLSGLDEQAFRGIHMHDVWTDLRHRFPAQLARTDWLAAIDEHYAAEAATLEPLVGAIEAIHSFAARGLAQVCVSNSNRRIVEANLQALELGKDIAFSISFDDVGQGKPDPEPYRLACERLGMVSHAVLAVEDSLTGLRSARAAGLRTAFCGAALAEPPDADVVVSRFDDLVAWVDTLRAQQPEDR